MSREARTAATTPAEHTAEQQLANTVNPLELQLTPDASPTRTAVSGSGGASMRSRAARLEQTEEERVAVISMDEKGGSSRGRRVDNIAPRISAPTVQAAAPPALNRKDSLTKLGIRPSPAAATNTGGSRGGAKNGSSAKSVTRGGNSSTRRSSRPAVHKDEDIELTSEEMMAAIDKKLKELDL